MLNTGLETIFSGFCGAIAAQFIKLITHYIKYKKINFKLLASTGGMPSSHSASTMALTTSVGLILGFDSIEYAIALGFTLIVMYDAAGLRRSAGQMAALLNRMVDDYYSEKISKINHVKLMEVLGHTPLEVLVGAIFGIFIANLLHHLLILI